MGLSGSAAKVSERQSHHLVDVELVRQAQARIGGLVRRTPVLEVDGLPGTEAVGLKLENLQRSGSFKLRGALNRILFDERPTSVSRQRRAATTASLWHMPAI